ncbi:MAG: SIS domain-containing protein [Anaerolineales bacterium]|nr:SIS domain-containing protein [Anaerolineales bacterium]
MSIPVTKSNLYREIHEQPEVLHRVLAQEGYIIEEIARAIGKLDINHLVIAARGTSDNAGRYAQYVLGARNQMLVTLATPSLYSLYKSPPLVKNTMVVGISQSGKSPDIVEVLAEARRQSVITAVFTNDPDSDLAEQGDLVVNLCAGQETAVAATKTYTAELAVIASLSNWLGKPSKRHDLAQELPEAVQKTLALNDTIAQVAPRYRYMQHSVVIGRGFNYATAFELALKLKELTYTIVEPYSSADFLHGPLAMIDNGFPVVVVAPSGRLDSEMETFVQTLKSHRAEIIGISDNQALLDQVRIPLALPAPLAEWLSPITAIIPGQLFAMHLAHTRDYNVDTPRSIRKVTETH